MPATGSAAAHLTETPAGPGRGVEAVVDRAGTDKLVEMAGAAIALHQGGSLDRLACQETAAIADMDAASGRIRSR